MAIDKGKGKRTATQKQYTSDSLNLAKNWKVVNTSKNPKAQGKAEDAIWKITGNSTSERTGSMGPAGKSFINSMKDNDIVKPKLKKGGSVGISKMKMGGGVKKMEIGGQFSKAAPSTISTHVPAAVKPSPVPRTMTHERSHVGPQKPMMKKGGMVGKSKKK
jgi:hypothetical protein